MTINLEAKIARRVEVRGLNAVSVESKGRLWGVMKSVVAGIFMFLVQNQLLNHRWDTENFVILCPIHASSKLPNEIPENQVKRRKHCTPKGQSPTQLAQVSPKS